MHFWLLQVLKKSENHNVVFEASHCWSDKIGLIVHLQLQRYDGFMFSKYCSLPMQVATCVRFSHNSNQLLTFNISSRVQENSRKVSAILDSFLRKHCSHHHPSFTLGGGGNTDKHSVFSSATCNCKLLVDILKNMIML